MRTITAPTSGSREAFDYGDVNLVTRHRPFDLASLNNDVERKLSAYDEHLSTSTQVSRKSLENYYLLISLITQFNSYHPNTSMHLFEHRNNKICYNNTSHMQQNQQFFIGLVVLGDSNCTFLNLMTLYAQSFGSLRDIWHLL